MTTSLLNILTDKHQQLNLIAIGMCSVDIGIQYLTCCIQHRPKFSWCSLTFCRYFSTFMDIFL